MVNQTQRDQDIRHESDSPQPPTVPQNQLRKNQNRPVPEQLPNVYNLKDHQNC